MRDLLPGICLAVAASVCFNLAIVVQAGEVRAVPDVLNLRVSLLGQLLRRPRWVAALALSGIAVPLQTLALLFAPLAVVQPADTVGLAVLLAAGSRRYGERAGPREIGGALTIVFGVTAVIVAAPQRTNDHAGLAVLLAVVTPLALVALAPLLVARLRTRSIAGVLTAGLAFALGTFALQLVAEALDRGNWLGAAAWAVAGGVVGAAGMTSEMSALQVRPLARVSPMIFAIELLVPIALGVLIGGDAWPGEAAKLALLTGGLALTTAGAFALLRSPAVSRDKPPAGGADSPA